MVVLHHLDGSGGRDSASLDDDMIEITEILSKEQVHDALCEIPLQSTETVSKYANLEQIQKDGISIMLHEQVGFVAYIISEERIKELAVDIANHARKIDSARKWAARVVNEWSLQVEFLYIFDFLNLLFGARIFQIFVNVFCCVLK